MRTKITLFLLISVGEQAGFIPATCSWDDNVCVPSCESRHAVLGFVVLGRGSWVFFFCIVSSHLCGKMIQFYKHTCSSGWMIKHQDTIYRWVFVVNGIAAFLSLSFGQMVCSEERPEYSASR